MNLGPAGRVAWAKLSECFEIRGLVLEAGESIALHPDGTLHVGTLAAEGTVGDLTLRARTLVGFHPNGALSLGTLATGTVVTCDADGKVVASESADWPLETAPLC